MAEEVVAYVAQALWAADYSEAAIWVLNYGTAALEAAAFASSVYSMREQQRRAANAQRAAYESSLKDRYIMVRSATEPRQVVLGRQRVSGPVAYISSYGANREHLVFTVILAAHEIDAVETVYFDDEQVTLDGGGNVTGVNRRDLYTLTTAGATFTLSSEPAAGTVSASVAYGTTIVSLSVSVSGSDVTVSGGTAGQTGTVTIKYQPASSPWVVAAGTDLTALLNTDAGGSGSVTLSVVPVAGSVRVFAGFGLPATDAENGPVDITAYATVAGAVVTVTGCGYLSAQVTVQYRDGTAISKARVKSYLGASGQAADADMVAALPGIWTSAHAMTGLAYLRVELDYDQDAFPSGLPNVSAVVRGAKLYDPRTSTTVWSQNPALMMRYVATSGLLGRLDTSYINDTAIATAATVCDTSAAYVVNGQTYTRALYTAGVVAKSDMRAQDVLTDIAKAMAGRWCFMDGQMVVKAGAYVTPLQTLDETWLAGGQSVQVQPKSARGDVINVASGKFADESRDYIVTDYPRVTAAAYVTEDGAELPIDIQLNAVTFSAQAQQVVAAQMRDARLGLRVTLLCNMRAFPVRVFDTLYVSLARFGWTNKVFEVLDVSWTIDGGIQLVLKATDPAIWALGTSFAAADLPPNTTLPSPWKVPAVTGLAAVSGAGQLLRQADGTVMTRVQVSWDAISDAYVKDAGGVEVRYGLATAPESAWQSVDAPNAQTTAFLTENLRDGQLYLIKARAYNALVRGAWCLPILHKVIGKTGAPSNVTGLTGSVVSGRIVWKWDACTDLDYNVTEARLGGTDWASATTPPAFKGTANTFSQGVTAAGTYTLCVRHIDTTGNLSTATVSASVTVAATDLLGAGIYALVVTIYQQAATQPANASGGYYTFSGDIFTAPSGWSRSMPTSSTTPTWATQYLFETTTPGVPIPGPVATVGADPNFASVKSQFHFNAGFADSSPSPVTLTAGGSAAIVTSNYKFGGGSLTLNGSTDYAAFSSPTSQDLGSGDFTVEAWIYPTDVGSGDHTIFGSCEPTTANFAYFGFAVATSGALIARVRTVSAGALTTVTGSGTIPANAWTHVAMTRSSGTAYLWVGGVQVASAASWPTFPTAKQAYTAIGGYTNGYSGDRFKGQIDEFRITAGVARYTATFTPSGTEFVDGSSGDAYFGSVSLLAAFDGANLGTTFTDSSGYAHTISRAASTTKLSTAQIKAGTTSALFNGTSDYLTVGYASEFDLPGDFTIELYIYPLAIPSGAGASAGLINHRRMDTSATGTWGLDIGVGGVLVFGNWQTVTVHSGGAIASNTWTHVAVSRSGSTMKLFVGGVTVATWTDSTNFSTSLYGVNIGVAQATGGTSPANYDHFFSGYMDSLRFTKGVARYTADFAPPDGSFPIASAGGWPPAVKVYQDGSAGAVLALSYTAQTFTYDTAGNASPSSQTITFNANLNGGLTGTATFTCTLYNAAGSSLGTVTMGGSGNTRTLTSAQFASLGAAQSAVVVATLSGFTDQATIVKLRDGAGGITVFLTNETTTVATGSDGTGGDYSTAGGTMKLFDGIVDKTGTGSVAYSIVSYSGGLSSGNISINGTTGVYTVTGLTAAQGAAMMRAAYGGINYDKQFDIAKSLGGASAVSLQLTSDSVSLLADSTGYVASFSPANVTAKVINGAADDTANWTLTATAGPGVTAAMSGTLVSVTALSADSGYVTVTATRTGYTTLTKKLGLTKVRNAVAGGGTGPVSGGYFTDYIAHAHPAYAGVFFSSTGKVRTKDASNTYVDAGDWYAPNATGIGASYWVKLVARSGATTLTSGTVGSVVSLTSGQSWTYDSTSVAQVKAGVFDWSIYSDAGGTTLVASGTIDLSTDTT